MSWREWWEIERAARAASRPSLSSEPDMPAFANQRWLRSKSHWRKTYLISCGSETNAWLHVAAHRAAVEGPESTARRKPYGDQTFRHKSSARRGAQVQCLGEMPWVSRATAMWPDGRHMATAGT